MNASRPTSIYSIEGIISNVLRWGVLASLILVAAGTILCFVYSHDYGIHGGSASDLKALIHVETSQSFRLGAFANDLIAGHGQAIIQAGLLLLIATPVLRVAISIVTFAVEKDWKFVVITSIVFLFLMISLFLGKAG